MRFVLDAISRAAASLQLPRRPPAAPRLLGRVRWLRGSRRALAVMAAGAACGQRLVDCRGPCNPARIARVATLAGLLAACHAPADPSPGAGVAESARAPAAAALPWTEAFARAGVLLADEIVIEGPAGLADHVAIRQEPGVIAYQAQTLPEGFFQSATVIAAGSEVRAELDHWSLAALRRLTVLERPGEVPVTVQARGAAYFAYSEAGPGAAASPQRGAELSFQGQRPDVPRE